MRFNYAAAIIALALTALPGSAAARAAASPMDGPSLAVMQQAWGGSVCGGGPIRLLRVPMERGRVGRSFVGPFPANDGHCFILINSRYRFSNSAYCHLIVHEGGHLAGWRAPKGTEAVTANGTLDPYHSRDPRSVMAPNPYYVTPGCRRFSSQFTMRFVG